MRANLERASGRWPEILGALAGVSAQVLNGRHQPCPHCGGTDRFRWDDGNDTGHWYCNRCGGKDGQGGAGTGIDLLMRLRRLSYSEAADLVLKHLGEADTSIPDPPTAGTTAWWRIAPDVAVLRFPAPDGKRIRPYWWDGSRWQCKHAPGPRRLYWPRRLASAPVLIVEGEPAADAAARLFPGHAVVTWVGGTGNIKLATWDTLRGRRCQLWPDADPPGTKAMTWLAEHLDGLGCTVAVVTPPADLPKGWDLADADWTPEQAAEQLDRLAPLPPPNPSESPDSSTHHATPADTTIAGCRQQLSDAIAAGATGSGLAELVAQLASDGGHTVGAVGAIARELERERDQASDAQGQALAIAEGLERSAAGRHLTVEMLLPPTLAAAVQLVTQYLPVDGPSAVLPFLTACAGMVRLGTQVEGCAAARFRVPLNLFCCLVGRSGSKKSPVDRALIRDPLAPIVAAQVKANQLARENWLMECRGVKASDRAEAPVRQEIVVTEFTGEGLATQLECAEKAGRGLLIYRDELSGMFGSLNQYRSGRGSDEQQLLELFDGGGLTSLRVTGCRAYSRSHVSIGGNTQPDVLRQLVANGDASGLWARFLFVPLPERVVPLPRGVSADEVAAIEAAGELLQRTVGAIHQMPPLTYRLSREAEDLFLDYEEAQQQAALAAALGAHSALLGKAAGKVLRVAGVLQLLAVATDTAMPADPIGRGPLDAAMLLVDYANRWTIALHSDVADGGPSGLMLAIHRAARAHGGQASYRDLRHRLSRAHRTGLTSGGCGAILEALAEAGYGELQRGVRGAATYRATAEL